jgi:hypothetical protein
MKTNDKYNCYENWEHLSTYFQTDAMFETWLMKTRNIYPNDKLDVTCYGWNNHTICQLEIYIRMT